MTVVPQSGGSISRGSTSSLYDVLELILDRGLVIDVFVRVSLVGIEILKIDARIVVASVDTYLRFAEACNRLDLETGSKQPTQLTDLVGEITEGGAEGKSKGALTGAVEAVKDTLTGDGAEDEDEEEYEENGEDEQEEPEYEEEPRQQRRRRPARGASRRQRE
ncbi:gas vesicle structural protein GvpA [Streptomyces diastatochromogenes]|uniref:Gas vesicle protein A n=1 Tax=Streptomyces diastatochromogenes TaxID=42236 RepID=A0A233RRK0_STRDA|nr:gas vesicle structural protein GvpA [Streptomyces diastatochromogenes]MCZ0984665.1 gas vesicle structural protein GvpA [Streptomyces diastatochromogenes]OXY86022.1 gas vesicle protein [Streptomyces diastatochromogenes]